MPNEWRDHAKLRGRFHPQYPDDLEVLVHEGGPRLSSKRPELVWVRISNSNNDVFAGNVLNRPHQLESVKAGDAIQFIVPASGPHPLMVKTKYLAERPKWIIHPCNKCGMSELFDAPSDLMAKIFPNLPPGAEMKVFTSFCGVCGGVQGVERTECAVAKPEQTNAPKKWWQVWK